MSEYRKSSEQRLSVLYRYISALEQGDIDTLSTVLNEASHDPILNALLEDMDAVYQANDGTTVSELEARQTLSSVLASCQNGQQARDQQASLLQRMTTQNEKRNKGILMEEQATLPHPRIQNHRQPSPRQRKRGHRLQLLAALLVTCVLLGAIVALISTRQQHGGALTSGHGNSTATPVTATPTPALQEGQIIYKAQSADFSIPLAWSPDGKRIATAISRTEIESWDALTGKNVLTYSISGDIVTMVAWSPDGKSLAVAGSTSIYIFNGQSTALIRKFPPMQALSSAREPNALLNALLPQSGGNTTLDVAWSPDGRYLSASVWGTPSGVSIWDAQTGALVKRLTGLEYGGDFLQATWQPHGHLLAIIACPGTNYCPSPSANLWDTTTWRVVKQYPNVTKLAWSPDGSQLALLNTASNSQRVSIVDALTGQERAQITDPQALSLWNIHWSPDGRHLALDTVSKASKNPFIISLWNVANATLAYRSSLKGCFDSSWSPDSKYIACIQLVAQKANEQTSQSFIVIWAA